MLIQSKKFFLIILLMVFNKSIFAKQISIKEQQEFFCKLEQYDQCFYTGKCDYKDYVNYTDYFIKITGDINQNAKSLYDKLPKIYEWAGNDELSENFPHYIIYDGTFVSNLAYAYIDLKYKWLSWYKNNTGISYKKPKDIFLKNKGACGVKMFGKYLSLPLPEDADVETCFFNYRINDPWCQPDDKILMKNLFCQSGKECEIKW